MNVIDLDAAKLQARALFEARRSGVPCPPPTDLHPAMTAEDGYAVQRELTALLHETGERTTGFKIGLTSRAMQTSLGVDAPDYGPVLSSSTYDSGVTLVCSDFIAPRVECEIALLLDEDLAGPGITAVDVRRAASGAVAALEVVDSRIQNWRLQLPDTIADLASFGAAVLSNRVVSLGDLELKNTGLRTDDQRQHHGHRRRSSQPRRPTEGRCLAGQCPW